MGGAPPRNSQLTEPLSSGRQRSAIVHLWSLSTPPRVPPPLDPLFRPAALASRAFRAQATAGTARLALEQPDGSVFHFETPLSTDDGANSAQLQRLLKFALWSRGGFRLHLDAPADLVDSLRAHFTDTAPGRFDAEMIGQRVYDRPLEILHTRSLPPAHATTAPLGRHLDGCRIGFDLGGSDRKVAAVIDGRVVFSEETVWDPYPQADPQYHRDGIMDSLRKAAAHLPRVDAIGGSAAGVYVANRVKLASLFRGVPRDLFESRVKDLFLDLRQAWHDVPFEVVNDGEVTALAGAMTLRSNAVLGIALGTSTAAGYVTPDGNITSWLNELAFVPVDEHPQAPRDEWSGDRGCGVQYLSQQAVGRLLGPAGITVDRSLTLPQKLEAVQALMKDGDARARRIYETLGAYLGYSVAHFADFYDFRHVLVLGRVTSGPGGDVMIGVARQVLRTEFPALAERTAFHLPDEKDKRHGQAIAAASLPALR
jgi:predicted NBD/HSP70 family sugar kinase